MATVATPAPVPAASVTTAPVTVSTPALVCRPNASSNADAPGAIVALLGSREAKSLKVVTGGGAGRIANVTAAQESAVDVVQLVQAAGSSSPEPLHALEAIPTVTAFPGSTLMSI